MLAPTSLDPQAVFVQPDALRKVLQDGLVNGYDTSISGWGSDDDAAHTPEFRAFYEFVPLRECNTSARTLEDVLADAQRNFVKRCSPSPVSGLPRDEKERSEERRVGKE